MLDPLTIERMRCAAGDAPIVVALSGGGDSVALLRLLNEHLGAASLHALIVDHALRDGSADDAKRAQRYAAEIGVSAEVLTVAWPNGVKRGQAAARTARYEILCEHTRTLGAHVIAAAHTADDQIETVLMRAASGSSWRGLAGMAAFAPAPVWPEGRGLWLARPLLHQRRAALRAYLQAQKAGWVDDPANSNDAFERVRVRARVAELEAAGADVMRLAHLAARIRPHLDRLNTAAAALIARTARFDGPEIVLDRSQWRAPEHVRRRALSALITAAAGASRAPPTDAVERLDARMASADFAGASLGGAVVATTRDAFRISRDPGALSGRADGAPPSAPLPLTPSCLAVWDGRLELRADALGWSVVAAPDGAELRRGDARRPLAPLIAQHKAAWLLRQRAAHLLGGND